MNSKLKYDENTHYTKLYSFQIYPNEYQKELIEKFINANRYVYNWALDLELKQYELYKNNNAEKSFLSSITLCSKLTQHRRETKWLQEIPNTTLRSGIIDLENAFNKFFKKHTGYPKFKSKKKENSPHFHTRKDRMYIDGRYLKIEGISDYIDIGFETEFDKSQRNIFIKPVIRKNTYGNYFISFYIIKNKENISNNTTEIIGIDLNKKNYFALSNGKIYKSNTKKIKRLQKGARDSQYKYSKDLDRQYTLLRELEKTNPDISIDDIPMSNRAKKRKVRYDKRNAKLTNYVENEIHNITKDIIKSNPKGIVMENLDLRNMLKKHYISKEIRDYSFGKCKSIMKDKCNKNNIPFKLAPKEFNSSNICSNCGYQYDIKQKEKFICPNCGLKINRDINAAKNLANLFDSL